MPVFIGALIISQREGRINSFFARRMYADAEQYIAGTQVSGAARGWREDFMLRQTRIPDRL